MSGFVDGSRNTASGGTWRALRVSPTGELLVRDYLTQALYDGLIYQIRAGTIATGIAVQNVIADATAEMCVDTATGYTIQPIKYHTGIRDVATGTTLQVYVKAVATVSSAGTAFTPLNLLLSGPAATTTARVDSSAVTVTAELATTTRRLFEAEVLQTQSATVLAVGQLVSIQASAADLLFIGDHQACVYVQMASTTAFSLHFSSLDYIEMPTAQRTG
jgi:hypothetical protein